MNKYFAFSLHKAGSTLFYKLLRKGLNASENFNKNNPDAPIDTLSYLSVPHDLIKLGAVENVLLDPEFISKYNYDFNQERTVYGGFRFVPPFVDEKFLDGAGVMCLVRDPRDMLTSLYFSVKESHVLIKGAQGDKLKEFRERTQKIDIDTFVLNHLDRTDLIQKLLNITRIKDKGVSWRYEDVIFDKHRWFDEILQYIGVDLPKGIRKRIVESEDIRPNIEKANSHIRQVTPGDSRNKLKPKTLEKANEVLVEFLNEWGYS